MNPFQTPVVQPGKKRLSLVQRVLIALVICELTLVSTSLYFEYRMFEETVHQLLYSEQVKDRIQTMLAK